MLKLLNKYKLLSPTVKAGIWFTICNILQRGIQFITTPIFTRLLTTEQFGFYSLFMTWMNILLVFATLNITGGVYYNGLLKFKEDVNSYTSAIQWFCNLCTFIVFIMISLLYPLIEGILDIPYFYIVLMFILFVLQPSLGFWSAQERMSYRYRAVLTVTVINALLSPVLGVIIVFHTSLEGKGIVIGYVITNIIINIFFYINNFLKGKKFFKSEYWKYTLTLGVPLIPHYLSQIILGQSDRIMINFFCGASDAGLYTLAYQVALVMNIIINGINSAFTPWMYKELKCGRTVGIKRNSSLLIMLFLILSMIIVLLAPEIILILGTKEYLKAVWIIPPVMLSTFAIFIYSSFGTVLFYFEETQKVSLASLIGAVINILLNILFIPLFGFVVAGYTTFVSYVVMMFMYYIYMKNCCKKHNIDNLIFDIKKISTMFLILTGYSALAIWLYDRFFLRYIVLIILIFIIICNCRKIKRLAKYLTSDVNE